MALELEIARPHEDPRIAEILDAAYQRRARESRLSIELARHYPGYDPGLALLAVENGEPLGFALFVPREVRLLGAWVRLAIAAPIGVLPGMRGRGAASFLMRAGLSALKDRAIRGALVISEHALYRQHGFMPAWNSFTQRVGTALLPPETGAPGWGALASSHLPALQALQQANYAAISGSERRHGAAIEWESAIEGAHTLVWTQPNPRAFVRFRKRAELEITEAAADSPLAVAACLELFRRLAREHKQGEILAHLPPPHPLARALSRAGAVSECNELGGAGLLCISDWEGLLQDTREHWEAALRGRKDPRLSLGVGPRRVSVELGARGLCIGDRAVRQRHVELPSNWAAGLISGQRNASELVFALDPASAGTLDAEAHSILQALFPGGTPAWTYAPVFEIADE